MRNEVKRGKGQALAVQRDSLAHKPSQVLEALLHFPCTLCDGA